MAKLQEIQQAVRSLRSPAKAAFLMRFFKTGKGEYASGDIFLGLTVPQTRSIAKMFPEVDLDTLNKLLHSKFHEERLLAVIVLGKQFARSPEKIRRKILDLYLKAALKYVNNWDLVDSSAHQIVGCYLENKPRGLLKKLARSKNLWEKRIAIISTYHFIRLGQFADTMEISKILLNDKHDLIHKAVGWMLREVGKRSEKELRDFLDQHAGKMPRTALRYALEKFPLPTRKKYMEMFKLNPPA